MVCLDATFLIDLLRGQQETAQLVEHWKAENERVMIPAPALVEITSGATHAGSRKERGVIEKLLDVLDVLPLTKEAALRAGELDGLLVNAGETIGLVDVMIAAIVLEQGESLATKNERHFRRIPGMSLVRY